MKLNEKEIVRILRGFSTKATALVELRRNGATYLDHYETFQLSLEQFIKSNDVSGFDPGIERTGKGDMKFRRIESVAPELESFVKKLEGEQE